MKIRTDFVTNSSSSSFIVGKKYLTQTQQMKIRNHDTYCTEPYDEPWNIDENEKVMIGDVFMDNFSMSDFMEGMGIDMNMVTFNGGFDSYDLDDYDECENPELE